MPVETFSYLDSLNPSNPVASEGLVGGDDHIRGIKSTLKATFPNLTGAVTSTQTQLDAIAALLVSGVLRGNGAVPVGQIADFGGTTAPTGWIVCDGSAISRTTYADLYAYIGTTWGSGDGSTTFNVPELQDRFRRHRRSGGGALAGAVGTLQDPQNLAHAHTGSGSTGAVSNDHTHTFSGTTSGPSADHTHQVQQPSTSTAVNNGADKLVFLYSYTPVNSGTISASHSHTFSGTTSGVSANHSHTYSFTTSSNGGTEARPYSATVLTCIKT